jgi:hypothetical protein
MTSLFVAIPGWRLLRNLGAIGRVMLRILDSWVIPAFGSLDALTAMLAAKNS